MITDEQAVRYAADPINFMEERYMLPETQQLIQIEWWQKKYILEPLFYDLDENGKRKYDIALIAMPKKNGKSALGAGIGIYFAYCDEPFGEIIIAANAKDQASKIIYNKIRRSIMLEPDLLAAVQPLRQHEIEVRSTGTIIRCVAHQFETAAGLNPNLTLFDELWGFSDRKFYDELTLVPTRQQPLIVIVTYAGYDEEGLLWDLYSDGMAGEDVMEVEDGLELYVKRGLKDERMFMFWSHVNLASWVTTAYIDKKRKNMPPDVFARLHENRWVGAGSEFITQADIDGLHDTPWIKQVAPITDRYVKYVVATDLGLSHDRTVRVVGHLDPNTKKVMVDNIRIWQGTSEHHVQIAEVEADLVQCAKTFGMSTLVIDPWQMEYVIQRLSPYYVVRPFSFAADITYLSQALVTSLRSGILKCYTEPEFDKELKQTIIKQNPKGWRIDHPKRKVNDIVISVGMMTLEAIRGMYGSLGNMDDTTFNNAPSIASGIRGRDF